MLDGPVYVADFEEEGNRALVAVVPKQKEQIPSLIKVRRVLAQGNAVVKLDEIDYSLETLPAPMAGNPQQVGLPEELATALTAATAHDSTNPP